MRRIDSLTLNGSSFELLRDLKDPLIVTVKGKTKPTSRDKEPITFEETYELASHTLALDHPMHHWSRVTLEYLCGDVKALADYLNAQTDKTACFIPQCPEFLSHKDTFKPELLAALGYECQIDIEESDATYPMILIHQNHSLAKRYNLKFVEFWGLMEQLHTAFVHHYPKETNLKPLTPILKELLMKVYPTHFHQFVAKFTKVVTELDEHDEMTLDEMEFVIGIVNGTDFNQLMAKYLGKSY